MASLLWVVSCAVLLLVAPAATGAEMETGSGQPPCQRNIQNHDIQDKNIQDLLAGNMELLRGQAELRRELAKLRRRLETLQPELEPCPDLWTTFNDTCFRIGTDNRTAAGAATACSDLHPRGRLASLPLDLRYTVQHRFLDRALTVVDSSIARIWIGLRKEEVGWRWSDGTLLTDGGEWIPPLTSDVTGKECAVYEIAERGERYAYGWSEERCDRRAGFVCMMER